MDSFSLCVCARLSLSLVSLREVRVFLRFSSLVSFVKEARAVFLFLKNFRRISKQTLLLEEREMRERRAMEKRAKRGQKIKKKYRRLNSLFIERENEVTIFRTSHERPAERERERES
jgi:hypothetical protein